MARFHFSVRSLAAGTGARAVVAPRTLAFDLTALGDAPQGPGWFDSSWELVRGLEVREGLPSDARLTEWLEARPRPDPASRTASAATERHEQPGARLVPAAPHGALGHAVQFGDLGLAVAAEVTHLDQFSEFGIDGLELL